MTLVKWNDPNQKQDMSTLFKTEMNRLFQDFFGHGFYPQLTSIFPPINLYENEDNLVLTAELPGISANDLDIQIKGEILHLTGERKFEGEKNEGCYHRRERESGKFTKKITLPYQVEADKIKAKLENGILSVTMPKKAQEKPKKITVKVA